MMGLIHVEIDFINNGSTKWKRLRVLKVWILFRSAWCGRTECQARATSSKNNVFSKHKVSAHYISQADTAYCESSSHANFDILGRTDFEEAHHLGKCKSSLDLLDVNYIHILCTNVSSIKIEIANKHSHKKSKK